MNDLSGSIRVASWPACASATAARHSWSILPALGLLLLLIWINPVGYIGGSGDDWHYLEAARCIVAHGYCLPDTHWAARLPLTVPTAAAIALFGESREVLWLAPLVFGLLGLFAFWAMIARHFGVAAAGLAGFVLVATPVFGGQILGLNVGIVEFGLMMAALFCLDRATVRGRGWAIAAGLVLGLAILSRTTAAALLPIIIVVLFARGQKRLIAPLLAGWGVLLVAEMAGYWLVAGDPVFGWKLALGHTRLPTTELPPGIDLSQSPLFNPHFIAAWQRTMGIDVHWTIDGALNLLADPQIGLTLLVALVLMVLHRRHLVADGMIGTVPLWLLGAGIVYFGALAYALAIDPKPRMFIPVAACGAAIIGIITARAWHAGRAIGIAIMLILLTNGVLIGWWAFDSRRIERAAAAWVAEAPDRMAIDETTRRLLALAPGIRQLPSTPEPGRDRALRVMPGHCPATIGAPAGPSWPLARQILFPARGQDDGYRLCEFRRPG